MTKTRGVAERVPHIVGVVAFLLFWVPGLIFYGRFIDEFYYIACSKRLAWGYVDHPPLAPWLLRGVRMVLGDGLLALRLVPALAGGVAVSLTALMARRLGAGAWGQMFAAVGLMVAPLVQARFSFYSMNALEFALWTGVFSTLLLIEERREPRWWLLVGALLGLGFENKHTIVLLAVVLPVAMVITPARRHLATRWPWLGALLALALAAPNLVWQVVHGFPSLEFYHNADLYKNVPTPPHVVLWQQIQFMNPAILPMWVVGLTTLLRRRDEVDLRHVGLACLLLLILLMVAQKSRPDRIAGIYPVLLAAGAPWVERLLHRGRVRIRRTLAIIWLAAWTALLGPLGVPVLPPPLMARYAATIGIVPQLERGDGKTSPLPQWYADRLEWEALVDDVMQVVQQLTPQERAKAIVLALSYGDAGALELLGKDHGLPPVYAGHNNYWLWGPPAEQPAVVVVFGRERADLEPHFASVEHAATHTCTYCMRWRNDLPIWIAREPRRPLAALWPDLRHFE